MRKRGILNEQLSAALCRLGHTDTFAIGDSGLPVPDGVEVIDLAVVFGVPRFADVAQAILEEVVVEGAVLATETPDEITALVPADCTDRDTVDHEELKQRLEDCAFVVRTGETTPYANLIFRSGVPF
ncbi:D-ribose pyranase [Corynebacterium glaucum]|uniref:D-ribose pyranase n=1 Tax=Corynebacterium glaucum TaxID=187491 RepID=A0A1Q2HXZ0_9CORY|nr:D-ribose pyranase [Corynebacterium glaucum]AQQ15718.1 D-ribose pyranase [Corynebacterium glaucum]WJZ08221.1 D-ribose pyranase [Corynebacterium glaucum]